MSKWDKLLYRIRTLSLDLRFDELRKVIDTSSFFKEIKKNNNILRTLIKMNAPRGGSSHYTFRKAGCRTITIPKHSTIKKVYVEMVKDIVESEGKDSENS